jgi:microcystin-dependent protein
MPNEPIKGLNTPNTGDLVGAWGTTAVNANMQAIGGMLGGVLSISLAGATTIALTAPAGLTPGAGPTQQQNRILKFSGAQTGNALVTLSVPGDFIIDNQCTGTTAYLQFAPASGTGTYIGIPQGKKTPICFDGTNVDFVHASDPGTAYDLHGAIAVPLWMQACKVLPYLVKDGSTYSTAAYTALAQLLGSTFGGNGVTTFGVPDERSRMRLAWDNTGASGRVTAAGSGINGVQMGAAGGDQFLQSHNHGISDPGHVHPVTQDANKTGGGNQAPISGGPTYPGNAAASITVNSATTNISIVTTGSGGSQNMPPTIVSFLALIKT